MPYTQQLMKQARSKRLTLRRMRRRSNARKCLLCMANCSSCFEEEDYKGTCREGIGRLEMVGALHCDRLRQQLEKVFVLRKILDVPLSWCEQVLGHYNTEEEKNTKIETECDGDERNPVNWFALCHQCMDTSVSEAWSVYQQITALEVKMRELKEQVKERMLKEITRPQNRSWTWSQKQRVGRDPGGGLEGKIIDFVFPELTIISKVEKDDNYEDYHVGTDNNDEEMEMEYQFELDDISNYGDDFSGDINPLDDSPWRSKGSRSSKKKKNSGPAKKRIRKRVRNRKSRSSGIWHSCRDVNCRARYRIAEDLEAHNRAHEEREEKGGEKTELDCPHCTFPARDRVELGMHLQSRHKFQNRCYYFPCPKCDFKVQDDFPSLKTHFDTEHPLDDQSLGLPSDQPQQCSVCPKRCESLKSFVAHQKSCHPEQVGMEIKTLECNLCGLKFVTQLDLRIHENSKHIQSKLKNRFVCEECGESFQYRGRLNRHKIKHNKFKRDFVCHHCGLDYAYKWLLDDHCRKVHAGTAENYEKGGVGKVDPTENSTASATLEDEIKCRYCEFTCNIKGIMIRHLQQHKEEKGFKCNLCSKCYVNDAGLRRHIKIIHPPTSDNDVVHSCPHCSKPFKSLEYMRQHVRVNCKLKKLQKKPVNSVSVESSPVVLAMESIKLDSSGNVIQIFDVIPPEPKLILPHDYNSQ